MTMIHIPLSVLWNSFSFFADELQAICQLIGCVGFQPEKLSIAARDFGPTSCARMTRWFLRQLSDGLDGN
ncbi:hypothetical protein [Serratia inhibens]|uniref:hypothetical protein n=1 Tax=Serratia inhibens TaxID=2338073 RepID=UPI0032168CC4